MKNKNKNETQKIMCKKIYFYRIFELKNGSRHPEILISTKDTSCTDTKKQALQEAKFELFRIAKLEFPFASIKAEFEDVYLKACKTKNFEVFEALEKKHGYDAIYDDERITTEDDLTWEVFCLGDVSYSSDRNASFIYLKIFSKKVKK